MLKTAKDNKEDSKSTDSESKDSDSKDSNSNKSDASNDKKDDKTKNNKIGEIIANGVIELGKIGIKGLFDYLSSKKGESKPESSDNNNKDNEEMKIQLKNLADGQKELSEELKRRDEEKKQEIELKEEGMNEWKEEKNKIINLALKQIDINYIKNNFHNFKEIEEEIINLIFKTLNLDNKLKSSAYIKKMHKTLFEKIKGNIPEIQSLNFITIGFSGAGKSTLTNIILEINEAKEGDSIKSVTQEFKRYTSVKVPGITIYDTVGVEETTADRNLKEIKKEVQRLFNENLDDPKNSLHGILYCINNGSSSQRILPQEIEFILELNKLYNDSDILIIVFTQSMNPITERRKIELRQELNNDKIEIIPVLAKDFEFEYPNGTKFKMPAYGINNLIDIMKEKCKNKLIKCNTKQIAQRKMKEQFENDIKDKTLEINNKIRNHEFKNTLKEQFEFIIKELFDDVNLNFEYLEQIILEIKNKINIYKLYLFEEIKDKSHSQLYKGFNIINEKYNKKLDDFKIEETFREEYNEYYKTNIEEYIKKIIFENVSIKFLEKCKAFFAELICSDIKDEEIDDIVKSNLDNIFKNIKNN
jgi:ABC-type dipeptide/oligopeptide/nickel transport system ATPase subunit